MGSARLTMMTSLALVAGSMLAASAKTPPADVGPGRVAWFDITTTRLTQSREFYEKLLDWSFAPVSGTDQALEIVARGASIGTLRVAEGKISPFNGVVYVQVADIAASCKRASELGGTLAPGFPFDLPDGTGAIGLVLDPAGHPLGLYSRTPLASAPPPPRTTPPADDLAYFTRLESVWNEAHLRGAADALEPLWADDLIVVVPKMAPLSKPDALSFFRSGAIKFQRYETSDLSVRIHSDTAVVSGRVRRARERGGQLVEDDWRFTKVYVRTGGAWRVVSYHASEAAP